jgi:transcriptional regulator of heat shock response
MQTKTLIITILQKLQGSRTLADGLLAFVQSDYCSETDLKNIARFLNQAVKETKQKLYAQKQQTKKRKQEQQHAEHLQEIEEAEALLDSLNFA